MWRRCCGCCAVAAVACDAWELESRIQALLTLEPTGRVERIISPCGGGRRSAACVDGQHGGPSTCVCGRGKKNSAKEHALGRSRGGFSTKVHALTDALGGPLRFILTGGQESDSGQAANLLAGRKYAALLNTLKETRIEAVIPPRPTAPCSVPTTKICTRNVT